MVWRESPLLSPRMRARFPPQLEGYGQRIDTDSSPPRGFIAVSVKITVMQSTDRDRIFVTDLAPNCARLGEANMVRLARRAAADDARLSRDEFAVFLIAQADSFRCDATAAR